MKPQMTSFIHGYLLLRIKYLYFHLKETVSLSWFSENRNVVIVFCTEFFCPTRCTLPETNSSPLKIGRAPKGNNRIPTIHFQVPAVSFTEIYRLKMFAQVELSILQRMHAALEEEPLDGEDDLS